MFAYRIRLVDKHCFVAGGDRGAHVCPCARRDFGRCFGVVAWPATPDPRGQIDGRGRVVLITPASPAHTPQCGQITGAAGQRESGIPLITPKRKTERTRTGTAIDLRGSRVGVVLLFLPSPLVSRENMRFNCVVEIRRSISRHRYADVEYNELSFAECCN